MALTKLAGLDQEITAVAFHGLLTYCGTNQGNVYSMLNSSGAFTLLGSIPEGIVGMSINHPTLYVVGNQGNVYTYTITTSADLPAGTSVGSSANTAGSGAALGGSTTATSRVYADDGSAALTAGAYRATVSRMLCSHAVSAGDISVYGVQSQLKVVADMSAATGILGGEWGYVELSSAGKVNVAGALVGHVDLPTGAVVTGYLAGVLCKSNDLGGTHTGKVVGMYVPNPGAGLFDGLIAMDGSAMTFDTTSITGDLTPTGYKGIPVYIGGTLGYIPWATAWA